jgi:hypothetical protein
LPLLVGRKTCFLIEKTGANGAALRCPQRLNIFFSHSDFNSKIGMQLPEIDRSSAEAWLSVPVDQMEELVEKLGLVPTTSDKKYIYSQSLAQYFRGDFVKFDHRKSAIHGQLKAQQRELAMVRPHPVTLLDLSYSNLSVIPCRIVELYLQHCHLRSLDCSLPETLAILPS